ncbi:MAG: DinB family protein [Chitinophagaceae bacterium]|nr:DinB family protein [Chitinophagaceae bacterium]
MKKRVIVLVLGIFLVNMVNAFYTNNDSLKMNLLKEWKRAKVYTDEYLQAMPVNKYNYRAVDSIRSFSELMLHLAQSNLFFGSMGTGAERISFGTGLEKRLTAQNKDSVQYYVDKSYDYVIESLANMDAAKIDEGVKSRMSEMPRYIWLLKGFEHQTHERGQCTIYIRLQGIRPPAERLM